MIRKILIATFALSFILFLSPTSRACFCSSISVEGAFIMADVVFIGKVIKITPVKEASVVLLMKESGTLELLKNPRWEKNIDKAWSVLLEVSEGFKGVESKTIEILSAVYNGGGNCGVHFKVGESYLVYADKRESLLSENEAKLPKESWTKEMQLNAEADKFNEKLPLLTTNVCARTWFLRGSKEDIEKIRGFVKNGLPKRPD